MTQGNQTSKIDLILDDLLSEIGYNTFFDPMSFSEKTEPVSVENTYTQIYSEYPDKYKKMFPILQQKINNLFGFMNYKMNRNRHFNANESRELLGIISTLDNLFLNLKRENIEIIIADSYKNVIDECRKFLEMSGGSLIPSDFSEINIIRYEPVFYINKSSEMTTRQQAASIKLEFNNNYMQQQIDQMVESIEKHPADAIGKAKELIESCCKAILSKKESNIDLDSLDINTLIKKVKEELNLDSRHQSVKQIIGGLSAVATGIAQLRNAKGTGHGKDAVKFKEPSIIEARLSVDSAITLVHFFWNLSKEDKE